MSTSPEERQCVEQLVAMLVSNQYIPPAEWLARLQSFKDTSTDAAHHWFEHNLFLDTWYRELAQREQHAPALLPDPKPPLAPTSGGGGIVAGTRRRRPAARPHAIRQ